MTDLRRHLPAIAALLSKELRRRADQAALSAADLEELRAAVRALLPASYGVGSGALVGQADATEPFPLLLVDRTLPGAPQSDGPGRYDAAHILACFDLALRHTPESLAAALERIAAMKALRDPQPIPAKALKAGRLPKQRFPLGGAMFWSVDGVPLDAGQRRLCALLAELIGGQPRHRQPDFVWALGHAVAFRNPALEVFDPPAHLSGLTLQPEHRKPRNCYVCKRPFFRRHFFYEQLCADCGDFNYHKRTQSADLSGRIALVTGGRAGIGYAVALRLLRVGAQVIVTTRFPQSAALQYAQEPDVAAWMGRLHIYGLDLRHTPLVEQFAAYLDERYPALDALINNAAQTVRHPIEHYAPLLAVEERDRALLPPASQVLLGEVRQLLGAPQQAEQLPAAPAAHGVSWRLRLEEISAVELVEVQLINAVAPALLAARLRPLLMRSPHAQRYIINVTAQEGSFTSTKQPYHPHTNMAKAALNMLTHTIAADYAASGILTNSIDPGWVSDQAPWRSDEPLATPLDVQDAAARICDPLFSALQLYGALLKDFRQVPW